jgi:hypothetical protein
MMLVVCTLVNVSHRVWADELQTNEVLTVILELSDGSRVVGTPGIESVPVQTPYAKINVPLNQILGIALEADHETASFELQNGDKLTGIVNLGPLPLSTLFGKVTIPVEHIRTVHVSLSGGAFARKGLVLWNRLDSEFEVSRGAFGPGGKLNAGRFVEGRFGKGIELNMQEQFGVTFPVDIVPTAAGCIEFWARLTDLPQALPWGQRPGLIGTNDKDEGNRGSILHFNGNDGASNGGLCIGLGGIGSAGTAQYGNWTYARALGTDAVSDWHHYALVWNTAGIPGVAEGTRCIALFVDGRLNTGLWNGAAAPTGPLDMPKDGRLGLLCHQGMPSPSTRVVFDNLKIWSYAKTDFGDRTEE